MKLLVKLPTRSRPHQFLNVLNLLNQKAKDSDINYLISIDTDDSTMTQEVLDQALNVNNVIIKKGTSQSKIHACNRDMEINTGWDIVALISDDMIPQMDGWDAIIRQKMIDSYPDTDGCLWFNDGYQDRICTLNIMGKKYYDRFGYLYHPDYHSLFCDNEYTEVARGLGRMDYFEDCLFMHSHFANDPTVKRDKLYDRNEALFNIDKQTFERRKAQGFPI